MSDLQKEKPQHKDGQSWNIIKKFSTFAEADNFRKACLTDTAKQAKVKRTLKPDGEEVFIVKTRVIPLQITTKK